MRRCAICHGSLEGLNYVVRKKRPHVSICYGCLGIRMTPDGKLVHYDELDRTKGRWEHESDEVSDE